MTIVFYNDYLRMRAAHPRKIPEVEALSPVMKQRSDASEVEKVKNVYLKALKETSKAIINGALDRFSATVGDHLCQVASARVLLLGRDPTIQEEAKKISNTRLSNRDLYISPEMNYLLRAYILNSGQTFSVSRAGSRTLKIEPQRAMHALSVKEKTFLATMKEIIDFSKEAMNKETVESGEVFAKLELPKTEAQLVSEAYMKRGEGDLMKNPLLFPNAYFITKAALRVFDRMKASCALIPYDPAMGFPIMKRSEGAPDVLIHAFFPEGVDTESTRRKVDEYGFKEFLLARIAQEAQFEDLPQESREEILRTGGDFAHLPSEAKEEIARYRKMGAEMQDLPRITHFTLSRP